MRSIKLINASWYLLSLLLRVKLNLLEIWLLITHYLVTTLHLHIISVYTIVVLHDSLEKISNKAIRTNDILQICTTIEILLACLECVRKLTLSDVLLSIMCNFLARHFHAGCQSGSRRLHRRNTSHVDSRSCVFPAKINTRVNHMHLW